MASRILSAKSVVERDGDDSSSNLHSALMLERIFGVSQNFRILT
jgi:hypothetical protein